MRWASTLSKRNGETLVLSLGLGLFGSRVVAEFSLSQLSILEILSLTTILIAASWTLCLAARRRLVLTPLALTWVYVAFPRLDPAVAAATAAWVATSLLIVNLRGFGSRYGDWAFFLGGFGLYLSTLAPSVLPADGGELQLVPYILGVAHPPGYPLYTLLGKLFTLLPVGDVAYRINLMSAVAGALTVVLIARTVSAVVGSWLAGAVAAVTLAGSTTFWSSATTANVRMFTAFFAALVLYSLTQYSFTKNPRYLIVFGVAFGSGVVHHLSLAIMGLPALFFLLVTDPNLFWQPRRWMNPALAFGLSLLVVLYIPLRALTGAPFGTEGLTGAREVLVHILGLGFSGGFFAYARPELLSERLTYLPDVLLMQFHPVMLLLSGAGFLLMLRRHARLVLLWGGTFLAIVLLGFTYGAPGTARYVLPAFLTLALALGYLAGGVVRSVPHPSLQAIAVSFLLLLGGPQIVDRYASFAMLSRDNSTRAYAEYTLKNAPETAVILSNWHWSTPFWYLQQVEKVRPDVSVDYVYPVAGEPIEQTWLRRLEEKVERGPVITTDYLPGFAAWLHRPLPLGQAFLFQRNPSYSVFEPIVSLDVVFGNRIRFLGYRMESQVPMVGRPFALTIYWQPLEPMEREYSLFVHMLDGNGQRVGQRDLTYPRGSFQVGQVVAERLEIAVPPTVAPGRYQLIAGVYLTKPGVGWERLRTGQGQDTLFLASVDLKPLELDLASLHPLFQPFGSGPVLVGVDYDHSITGTRRVYLHWLYSRGTPGNYQVMLLSGDKEIARRSLKGNGLAPGGRLTWAWDTPVDADNLKLEVRGDNGRVLPVVGPWGLVTGSRFALPAPSAESRYLDWGGEMLLMEIRHGSQGAPKPGDKVRFELKFVSLRPLTSDYALRLELNGLDQEWVGFPSESRLTGDLISTLQWIHGTVVWDRRFVSILRVPEDKVADLNVGIYDAFSGRPLEILDERFARPVAVFSFRDLFR